MKVTAKFASMCQRHSQFNKYTAPRYPWCLFSSQKYATTTAAATQQQEQQEQQDQTAQGIKP